MKSDRFLIKVAELYYRDGLSQQEIAKKLHTSRTSISRALQQHLQAGTLTVQPTSGGGSAARAAATATISVLSARAAPTRTTRTSCMASLPRSAFTDIFIPFV